MSGWIVIAIRALGALIMLFALTRILGKKQISQLTFFEYITGIVIGDLAGFMSTDVEANYWHGAIAMLVWFSVPLLAELLALKSKKVRILLEGEGTVFIQEGKVLEKNLRKERYTTDELLEQLRTKSVFNPADVEFAILEASGDLSVMLKEEYQPLTPHAAGMHPKRILPPQPVIMDGTVQEDGLTSLGFDKAWLEEELQRSGHTVEDIFLAVADENGGMYLDFYEDKLKPVPKRRVRKRNSLSR
jgi:uncharacterized membrane protein YcaP (DUF421 family)